MKCCEDCVLRFVCANDDYEGYCETRAIEMKRELGEEKLGRIK